MDTINATIFLFFGLSFIFMIYAFIEERQIIKKQQQINNTIEKMLQDIAIEQLTNKKVSKTKK